MEAAFQVETRRIDLERIVEDVFSTMLGMDTSPISEAVPAAELLTAAIQFVGEWKGAVLLNCGPKVASALAARLMPFPSGPGGSISKDDVSDTLGEVVNMIAGNLKSVLPAGVVLSIPSVVEGRDFIFRICGGNEYKTNYYSCEEGPFAITLVRVLS